jgi:hypothetical protein
MTKRKRGEDDDAEDGDGDGDKNEEIWEVCNLLIIKLLNLAGK